MGKGDIKTRKGKIVNGSYGNTRPRHHKVTTLKSTENTVTEDKTEKPKAKESKAKK